MKSICRRCNRAVDIVTADGFCKRCNGVLKWQRAAAHMNEKLPRINRMLSGGLVR